jgi:CHAD domain-containing protein
MRVGLRRLRAALKLFRNLAPCPPDLLAELSWLGGELGQARDWEVLLGSTLPRIATALPDQAAALAPLTQACESIVQEKHRQAADALASARFARLTLAFGAWLTGRRWRGGRQGRRQKKLQAPLTQFSRQVLARDQAALLRRGRRLAHADAAARHRLRIAAKKTRYASEFFQSLHPRKRVKPYVATLTELQDALGWLNDAAVADGLLTTLQQTGTDSAALSGPAGFARGYLHAAPALELPELLKLWKRFARTRPPCRK